MALLSSKDTYHDRLCQTRPPAASTELKADSGQVFAFDELMYPPGSRKEASRLTSDHRPISIRVRITGPDDD